jgi:peptidoglycan/LPS O-acetylase OafA/YrhL
MILVVGTGILASAALRSVLYSLRPAGGPEWVAAIYRLYMGSDTRADALLVGCLVALYATYGLMPKSRWRRSANRAGALASVAGLAYILLYYRMDHRHCYYGVFTLVALLVAVILVRLLSASWGLASRLLESTLLVGIGRISYGLYLYHIPMMKWLGPPTLGWSIDTLHVAGASLAAAVVSYYVIERPCLRLKSRLQALPNETPVAAPTQGPPVLRSAA